MMSTVQSRLSMTYRCSFESLIIISVSRDKILCSSKPWFCQWPNGASSSVFVARRDRRFRVRFCNISVIKIIITVLFGLYVHIFSFRTVRFFVYVSVVFLEMLIEKRKGTAVDCYNYFDNHNNLSKIIITIWFMSWNR